MVQAQLHKSSNLTGILMIDSYVSLKVMHQTMLDNIDLKIMNLLSTLCRTHRNIASTVGISTNAVKTRVNKNLTDCFM